LITDLIYADNAYELIIMIINDIDYIKLIAKNTRKYLPPEHTIIENSQSRNDDTIIAAS